MEFLFESERLWFRETTPDDAEEMYKLNSDPDVMRYTGDVYWDSVEQAREFLSNYSDFRKNKMGRWAAIRKEDGAMIGWCGLKLHADGMVDLGYRLFKKYWNQGFATEAGLVNLEYGFETLKLKEIVGQVIPEHAASIRVLEKVGMTYSHDALDEDEGYKILVYKITNENFRRHQSVSA